MRRILNIFLGLTIICVLFSTCAYAENPWKEEYYRLSDLSGELEAADRYDLDRTIIDFMQEYHQDIVVIAIPTERMHGFSADEFGREYYLESGFGYGEDQSGFVGVYLTDANTYDLVRIGSAKDKFTDSDVELAEELVPTLYEKYGMYGVMYGAIRTIESAYEDKADNNTETENENDTESVNDTVTQTETHTDNMDSAPENDSQSDYDNGLFDVRDPQFSIKDAIKDAEEESTDNSEQITNAIDAESNENDSVHTESFNWILSFVMVVIVCGAVILICKKR